MEQGREGMKAVRTTATIILLTLLLSSCVTQPEPMPQLPHVSFQTPERPVLLSVNEDVPEEATENLIALTAYTEGLLAVISAWESYYRGLMEIYTE